MAAKLGLPFGAGDLKSALRAQAPYPAAWDQIDWTKPMAAVVLALPSMQSDAGASPGPKRVGSVAVFTPRPGGPTTALAWAPSFGAVVERRQEAVAVAAAGGDGGATSAGRGPSPPGSDAVPERLYLLVRDGALLVADSWPSLTQGGALALAARHADGAGPTLSLRPAGIAKIQGTTVAAALEQARARVHQAAKVDAKTPAAIRPFIDDLTGLAIGWVADTESVDLGLALDQKEGLRLSVALRPVAGTAFAKLIASGEPYRVEPALLGPARPAFFAATGATEWLKAFASVIRKSLESMAPSPGGGFSKEEALKTFDVLTDTWTGAGTLAVSADDDLSYDFVYRLAESKPGLLRERLEHAVGPWPLGELGRLAPSLAGSSFVLEKDDDAFYGHFLRGKTKGAQERKAKTKRRDTTPTSGADVLSSLSFRAALEGDRLVAAVGVANKDHFQRLRNAVKSDARPPANGPLAEALTATSGALAVEYVDLAALGRVALRTAASPDARGHAREVGAVAAMADALGDTPLAVFAEIRGGETLLTRLRIPMETASTAARLAMQFLSGAMGGSSPPRAW